jgi:hypothetical protein
VKNLPKGIKFAIYFNIVGIIVLDEPTDQFSEIASQETAEAFRVDKIREFEEVPDTLPKDTPEALALANEEVLLDESFL